MERWKDDDAAADWSGAVRVPILCAALLLVACGEAPYNPPQSASDYCIRVWRLRDQVQNLTPSTIVDIEHKDAIMDRAAWCEKNPQGISF